MRVKMCVRVRACSLVCVDYIILIVMPSKSAMGVFRMGKCEYAVKYMCVLLCLCHNFSEIPLNVYVFRMGKCAMCCKIQEYSIVLMQYYCSYAIILFLCNNIILMQ